MTSVKFILLRITDKNWLCDKFFFLDIVFFYKAVNNLVFIDSEALPTTRQSTRSTRSSSSNAITYIPK